MNLDIDGREISIENYHNIPDSEDTFPTLAGLTELQIKNGEGPRKKPDPNVAAAPFPPRRRKTELLKKLNLNEIEDHCALVTLDPAMEWSDLANQLFSEPCTTNLDKVWAAFCFACKNWDLSDGKTDVTQAYMDISSKKYSRIFENLMKNSGVPYKRIQGYKKSVAREVGWHYEKSNGVWFACWVEGEWRFVDPSWGAASVVTTKATGEGSEYIEFDTIRESTVQLTSGKIVARRNDFFFLTDPEKMIVSHYPKNSGEWQLLARPLSLEEFEQMPHYFSGSEKAMEQYYQVEPINYRRNVIVVDKDPVELSFKVPYKIQLEFDLVQSIFDQKLSSKARNDIIKGFPPYMRKDRSRSQHTIQFCPPCEGKFKLVVRLRPEGKEEEKWIRYLAYVVHYNPQEDNKTVTTKTQYTETDPAPKRISSGRTPPETRRFPQLQVSRAQLAKLRSYAKPPEITFNVVRATLLMLGFYEKRSRKWHRCQPLINAIPQAVKDIVLSSIDPRIAARSRQLLNVSDETEASLANVDDATVEFYRWVNYTSKAILDMSPNNMHEPASVEVQKVVFQVTSQEDAHWDWEDDVVRDDHGRKMIGFCETCHVAVYSSDLKLHLHCCVTSSNTDGRHTARV